MPEPTKDGSDEPFGRAGAGDNRELTLDTVLSKSDGLICLTGGAEGLLPGFTDQLLGVGSDIELVRLALRQRIIAAEDIGS